MASADQLRLAADRMELVGAEVLLFLVKQKMQVNVLAR